MPSSSANKKNKKVKFAGVARVRMIEPNSARLSRTQIYLATKKHDGSAMTASRRRQAPTTSKARRKPNSPNRAFVNDRWAANLSTGNIVRLRRGNDRGVPLDIAMKFLNHYFPQNSNGTTRKKNAKPSSRF